MKRTLTILSLVVALPLFAQLSHWWAAAPKAAAVGGGVTLNPTNIDGVTPSGWWVADDYTTNGAWATLPDRYGGHDLTNAAGANSPLGIVNGLATYRTVRFLTNRLQCMTWTNAQPEEVWMVMCYTNTGTITELWQSSPASGVRVYLNPNQLTINAGSAYALTAKPHPDEWMVLSFSLNSAGYGRGFTNNVALSADANVGTKVRTNLSLGTFVSSYGFPWCGQLAEMAMYSATNTTIQRSNLYYYFTNKYGVMP